MEHRGVRASVGVSRTRPCGAPPCPPPLGRRPRQDGAGVALVRRLHRGEAGRRRPRRDAPTAEAQVPTPTPRRRPTRPYLPGGHISIKSLDLAYRARRAFLQPALRPRLPCPEGITATSASTSPRVPG